jgi:segregation and condensation protein A
MGDPREELVQRLVEYRQFKEAAHSLKVREEERRMLHERGMLPTEEDAGPLPLARVSLFDLLEALNRVLARAPEPQTYEVRAETFAVEDKMQLLAEALRERGSLSFEALLVGCRSRAEMIVTFIALLELIKLGAALIVQHQTFGDITIVAGPAGETERASHESAPGA